MAFAKRHLILFLGLALTGLAQPQEPEKPVTFRAIAVGGAIAALYYDVAPGKAVAVSAGGADLSRAYTSPPGGKIGFYLEVPSAKPGEKPKRVPVANAQLGKGGPYLVVLSSQADPAEGVKVDARVVDDSWDAHPKQTIRVFNFSRRRAAVQLEVETKELGTAEAHIFPYPPGRGAADFKVALMEAGGWGLRACSPRGIIPNTRSTVVITDVLPTPEEPNPLGVNITDVFDFSLPPQPPVAQPKS